MTGASEATQDICPDCCGTGGGHPDNLAGKCYRCDGTGGIPKTTDLCTRLRACGHPASTGGGGPFNPDGPEAALRIEQLEVALHRIGYRRPDGSWGPTLDECVTIAREALGHD